MKKHRYTTKDGQFFTCKKCNGFGKYTYKSGKMKTKTMYKNGKVFQKIVAVRTKVYCELCSGSGKINWLDNILRKKEK
jgi:hypothetical protein